MFHFNCLFVIIKHTKHTHPNTYTHTHTADQSTQGSTACAAHDPIRLSHETNQGSRPSGGVECRVAVCTRELTCWRNETNNILCIRKAKVTSYLNNKQTNTNKQNRKHSNMHEHMSVGTTRPLRVPCCRTRTFACWCLVVVCGWLGVCCHSKWCWLPLMSLFQPAGFQEKIPMNSCLFFHAAAAAG